MFQTMKVWELQNLYRDCRIITDSSLGLYNRVNVVDYGAHGANVVFEVNLQQALSSFDTFVPPIMRFQDGDGALAKALGINFGARRLAVTLGEFYFGQKFTVDATAGAYFRPYNDFTGWDDPNFSIPDLPELDLLVVASYNATNEDRLIGQTLQYATNAGAKRFLKRQTTVGVGQDFWVLPAPERACSLLLKWARQWLAMVQQGEESYQAYMAQTPEYWRKFESFVKPLARRGITLDLNDEWSAVLSGRPVATRRVFYSEYGLRDLELTLSMAK